MKIKEQNIKYKKKYSGDFDSTQFSLKIMFYYKLNYKPISLLHFL